VYKLIKFFAVISDNHCVPGWSRDTPEWRPMHLPLYIHTTTDTIHTVVGDVWIRSV